MQCGVWELTRSYKTCVSQDGNFARVDGTTAAGEQVIISGRPCAEGKALISPNPSARLMIQYLPPL